jgi:vancomycin permeability regulator SanA
VSQFFHVPRARRTLRRCGVPTVCGAHADYFEWRDVYATAREVLAYYAYLLKT